MASIGGDLYVFGGDDGSNYLNDLWRITPPVGQWERLTPPVAPPVRSGHTMVALPFGGGTSLFVFGGSRLSIAYDDLWMYDTANNTWTDISPLIRPPGRDFATSVAIGKCSSASGTDDALCVGPP